MKHPAPGRVVKRLDRQSGPVGRELCLVHMQITHLLPLSAFRSRHGSVSEAVGYGKSLMFFHMLRRRLGDETFITGLRSFDETHRSRMASFEDLRIAFEGASGESLDALFQQWLTRTGAPRLEGDDMSLVGGDDGFLLRGTLRQVQDEEPFLLSVPLAVTLAGGARPWKEPSP